MKKYKKIILYGITIIIAINTIIILGLLIQGSRGIEDLMGIISLLLIPLAVGFVLLSIWIVAALKKDRILLKVKMLWVVGLLFFTVWIVTLSNSIDRVDASGGEGDIYTGIQWLAIGVTVNILAVALQLFSHQKHDTLK